MKQATIILILISGLFGQDWIPFQTTDNPTFSTIRSIANTDSLTHKIGFSKGYTIYPNIRRLQDDFWINSAYRVDMDNDGVFETSWQGEYEHVTFDYPEVA